jgi:hypothetical protein
MTVTPGGAPSHCGMTRHTNNAICKTKGNHCIRKRKKANRRHHLSAAGRKTAELDGCLQGHHPPIWSPSDMRTATQRHPICKTCPSDMRTATQRHPICKTCHAPCDHLQRPRDWLARRCLQQLPVLIRRRHLFELLDVVPKGDLR